MHNIQNLGRRRRGILIYFLGVEGVGKSTHSNLLLAWLHKKGYLVKLVYIRSDHLILHVLKKFLMLMGRRDISIRPNGSKVIIAQRDLIKRMRYLWIFTNILMSLFLAIWRVWIPMKIGYVIIAERYLLDTFIDLMNMLRIFNLRYKGIVRKAMRLLLYFIPKNTVIIHLWAPYKELLKRYVQRGTPAEPKCWIVLNELLHSVFLKIYSNIVLVSIDTSKHCIVESQLIIRKSIRKSLEL